MVLLDNDFYNFLIGPKTFILWVEKVGSGQNKLILKWQNSVGIRWKGGGVVFSLVSGVFRGNFIIT